METFDSFYSINQSVYEICGVLLASVNA